MSISSSTPRGRLLEAKLYIPHAPRDAVLRSRLLAALDEALADGCKVTLVSAPAGYGKSTILADWSRLCGRPTAWVSLDERDNHLPLFVRYLASAIRRVYPGSFPGVDDLLQLSEPLAPQALAESLAGELADLPGPCSLILDDYHLVTDTAVHAFMTRLVEDLPERAHVVLAARSDPPLPLARWRGRGQMKEVRGADLRFTAAETLLFFQNSLGSLVAADVVAALQERTDGWITALRLAELSISGQPALATSIVKVLAQTNRQVTNYLLDEVLAQQPLEVQDFLLKTSILHRFCAALCAAVIGDGDERAVQARLERLERSNLLLQALDERHGWFRYHPFLQESLRSRLEAQTPRAEIEQLQCRASEWCAEHGLPEEALDHALAAGDVPAAAGIVEGQMRVAMDHEQWLEVERWLSRLPSETVAGQPALLVMQAWVGQVRGRLVQTPLLLQTAQALMDRDGWQPGSMPRAAIEGAASIVWSMLYGLAGQNQDGLAHAERALKVTPPSFRYVSAIALLWWARCSQALGHEQEAIARLREALAASPPDDTVYLVNLLFAVLLVLRPAGRLQQIEEAGHQLVEVATEGHLALKALWGQTYLGYACYERGDLPAAIQHFSKISDDPAAAHALAVTDCVAGLALAYQALGRPLEATQVITNYVAHLRRTKGLGQVPWLQSLMARLSVARGDSAAAEAEIALVDSGPDTSLMHFLETPRMTQARVLLAQGIAQGSSSSLAEAAVILAQLAEHAAAIHNLPKTIEAMALQAAVQSAQGHTEPALDTLERALSLARPAGFVSVFVEIGQPMAALLRQFVERRAAAIAGNEALTRYVAQLRAACPPNPAFINTPTPPPPAPQPAPQPISSEPNIEPLTHREIDVLRLLARRYTYKEIAAELVITPGTVKVHTQNIYGKLGVDNRRDAVACAQALGLLPATSV